MQALADARIAQDGLIKALQRHPVFKTLPADVIALLVTKFDPYIFAADEEIFECVWRDVWSHLVPGAQMRLAF